MNEWIEDNYDPRYYSKSPKDNPVNLTGSGSMMTRGGSWVDKDPKEFRCARRSGGQLSADFGAWNGGFRCVKSADRQDK